jgi:hypothetical protein
VVGGYAPKLDRTGALVADKIYVARDRTSWADDAVSSALARTVDCLRDCRVASRDRRVAEPHTQATDALCLVESIGVPCL